MSSPGVILRAKRRLSDPDTGQLLPVILLPITVEEAFEAAQALPFGAHDGITHIWLRRLQGHELRANSRNWAECIGGSGARVIILDA